MCKSVVCASVCVRVLCVCLYVSVRVFVCVYVCAFVFPFLCLLACVRRQEKEVNAQVQEVKHAQDVVAIPCKLKFIIQRNERHIEKNNMPNYRVLNVLKNFTKRICPFL